MEHQYGRLWFIRISIKEIRTEKMRQNEESECRKEVRLKNRNGFTHPMTFQQSVPVLLVIMNLTELLYIFTSDDALRTIQTVAQLILTIATFVAVLVMWFRVTSIDPTDSIQQKHEHSLLNNVDLDKSLKKYNCGICQTYVSEHSFHCSRCNRCVELFDHHCKWVNNCIGGKNYFEFVGLVTVSLAFLLEVTVCNLVLALNEKVVFRMALQYVTMSINTVPTLALLYLALLHCYLLITKRSTIGLILERRKLHKIYTAEQSDIKTVVTNANGMSADNHSFLKHPVILTAVVQEENKIINHRRKYSRGNKVNPLTPIEPKPPTPKERTALSGNQSQHSSIPTPDLVHSPNPTL